mgnify:CR=1 FL=1
MKLNNKGFAISTIMYMILILAVILILATLSILGSRKLIIDKVKDETYNNIYRMHLARENVEVVINPTTGVVPSIDENGDFLPGSEFKIKVSDKIGWLTFFVLSNDGYYVNLIAQKNLVKDGTLSAENQTEDEWYVTSANSYDNRYGPQTAYTYLSQATSNWKNIPIIEKFIYTDIDDQPENATYNYGYHGIVTAFDRITADYITTITPFSSNYGTPVTYENMRARLPKYSEIIQNTSCTSTNGSCAEKSLWVVDYLKTNSYVSVGTSSTSYSSAYWLLSSGSKYNNLARYVGLNGWVNSGNTNNTNYGVRPVITVLKSDLVRVMNFN